ncbi:MAG: glucose-1-phosphate adenylyltransferase [Psychromonas sp.]|nr:glucose-1-phosphate adenylyltransferase [Psychromonas sp.]
MTQHLGLLTRDTISLVLAGGKGARLKHLTYNRAKPSLPFGGKYKIIDFTLSNCVNSGLRRVNVLTQYKSSDLLSHIQRAWGNMPWQLGEYVNIIPAQQQINESWYLGTADAVYQNLAQLKKEYCKYVLILGGDHIYKMDYSRMLRQHAKKNADISISCIPVPSHCASEFGAIIADKNLKITRFVEKSADPPEMTDSPGNSLASMGVYIFNFDVLERLLLNDASLEGSQHDFGYDIIPNAIKHEKVFAYVFDNNGTADVPAYWKDVGTLDQYYQANLDLVSIAPELNLYDEHWPIYSYREMLPGAKFIFDSEDCRGYAVDSIITAGCIISGATIRRSLISIRVIVNKFSYVLECLILPNATIEEDCRLYRVIVDEDCVIPKGISIGEDNAKDAEFFEVTKGGVTLVTQGMIDDYTSYHSKCKI